MQDFLFKSGAGAHAIRGVAGLIIIGLHGMASAAPGFAWFATDFRPDFRSIAEVSCPQTAAVPRSLIDAVACGDGFRVHARLVEGADVSVTESRLQLLGRTALHHAVQRADLSMVEALLAAGADPDVADAQGNTPLHLLAMRRRSDAEVAIARTLLGAGADGRLRNARGRTALAELIAFTWHGLDPLRIAAEPLGAVLDEAEATGPVVATHTGGVPAMAETSAKLIAATEAGTVAMAPHAAPVAAAGNAGEAVRAALENWAAAWSARDVDAYLGHYASEFKPADGKSFDAWREQRRERVAAAGSIEVKLSELAITFDGTRAVAQFLQEYRSDRHRSADRKMVVLVSDSDVWRIVEEKTAK
jgi:ketosteroid isomerase-like protein